MDATLTSNLISNMHPSYYGQGGGMPLSPTNQMAAANFRSNNNNQSSSMVRPAYVQVDFGGMGMPGPHLPSPTGYAPPPPPGFVMQRFHFSQNSPANAAMGMMARPPPLVTNSHEASINEQALRSLQERVAQIASIPRPTAQEVANYNAQHITPKNVGPEANRMLIQEVTHLNPPGTVRPPYANQHKLPHSSSSASLSDLIFSGRMTPAERQQANFRMSHPGTPSGSPPMVNLPPLPPPRSSLASEDLLSARSGVLGPTEEELRKLHELMPSGDDPESKKSIEEWKRLRLRVMSRLRKQRWRAKKKAEVLAGVEDTQREEAERKRRDRLRKQEQRAKKKMRAMDEGAAGTSVSGADSAGGNEESSPGSSVSDDE